MDGKLEETILTTLHRHDEQLIELRLKKKEERLELIEKNIERLDLRYATICKMLKLHGMDINKTDMNLDNL